MIREGTLGGFDPAVKERVDRTQRGLIIVRGVKVVGKSSPNSHGMRGASEGSVYTLEALQNALHLYEGLKVNVDHPPRKQPGAERSGLTRLGKIVNARIFEGEIYGDLHMLESVEMAETVANAAEAMPDAFALSHNAVGVGTVKDGKFVITEIPEVRSVDVVADGGTCTSLFESRQPMAKIQLRKLIRESKALDEKVRKRLLEMGDEYAPDMMDAEVPAPPEDGGAPEGDWKQSLVDAIGHLVSSDDADSHAIAQKIMAILKPEKAKEKETETEESDESDDKDKKKNTDEELGDGVKESREMKSELDRLKRKDAVRDLCESQAFAPTPLQLKALLAFDTEADRKAFITEAKQGKRPGNAPRSAGQFSTSVQEGRELPKTPAEQAALLFSRTR